MLLLIVTKIPVVKLPKLNEVKLISYVLSFMAPPYRGAIATALKALNSYTEKSLTVKSYKNA